MAPVIEARQLTKRYGAARGVAGLDFAVERGQIYGLLGPNGAGKTTTIRLLLDFIRPTSGEVRVLGLDPRRDSRGRGRIGYLPGDLRLYERLTARQQLTYFAGLRGLEGIGLAEELAERFDVELDRRLKTLSKGNRQKVGLLQAFMHEPELLILDEPTSGLDPLMQQTFNTVVGEVRDSGRTVLISSHVLPEVQHVADRVALLRDGELLFEDSIDGVRRRAFSRIRVTLAEPPSPAAFADIRGVRKLEQIGVRVTFALEGEPDALIKALAGHHVIALESTEPDLEDVFLSLYGPANA